MWTRLTKEFRFAAPVAGDVGEETGNIELTEQEFMDTIAAHRNLLRLLFVVTVAAVILRGPFT